MGNINRDTDLLLSLICLTIIHECYEESGDDLQLIERVTGLLGYGRIRESKSDLHVYLYSSNSQHIFANM